MNSTLPALLLSVSLVACGGPDLSDPNADTGVDDEIAASVTKASVGKRIFFDTRLSEPAGQACSSCHDAAAALSDRRHTASSQGAIAGRFGVRNTPSITYASYTPSLTAAGDETGYAGGLFVDGRAATLEVQVTGPMLNPLEMNNASKAAVIAKVKSGPYAKQFKQVFGSTVFNNVDTAFDHLTEAVAAYERTGITGRFTSKYDAYLAGKATLTAAEQRGLTLFEDDRSGTGGGCAQCHLDKPAMDGTPPLFTDFGYDNLGVPKKADNPFYRLPPELNPQGAGYIDHGLSGAIHNPRQDGKFKAPTLRNVTLTAPYGHNGYFATLKDVVDFYNTRDVGTWAAPEISFALNTDQAGDLKLSAQDVDDLVAFMGTLTDGYKP